MSFSTPSTLAAMLQQEHNRYMTRDYCMLAANERAVWRKKSIQWMINIRHRFHYCFSTVETAMNILDRYLAEIATYNDLSELRHFQLAAITSMYLASKLREHESIAPQVLTWETGFEVESIESMERSILSMIDWHVQPPTASDFIHQIAEQLPQGYFPGENLEQSRAVVAENACLQIEYEIWYTGFIGIKKSIIAVTAVWSVLDMYEISVDLFQDFPDLKVLANDKCNMSWIQERLRTSTVYYVPSLQEHLPGTVAPPMPPFQGWQSVDYDVQPNLHNAQNNFQQNGFPPESPRTVLDQVEQEDLEMECADTLLHFRKPRALCTDQQTVVEYNETDEVTRECAETLLNFV